MFAWHHKGDRKADIVDALYRDMLSDFVRQPTCVSGIHEMGARNIGSCKRPASVGQDAQTEQTLTDFARDTAAQREEYVSRRKAEREAVENPKTLEDFRAFMRFHMDDGKTAARTECSRGEQLTAWRRKQGYAKDKGGTCPFLRIPDHWRRNHRHQAHTEGA